MALIRDTKYVKTLSKLTNSGDVMDDACRMILSDSELKLRVLICVSLIGYPALECLGYPPKS